MTGPPTRLCPIFTLNAANKVDTMLSRKLIGHNTMEHAGTEYKDVTTDHYEH